MAKDVGSAERFLTSDAPIDLAGTPDRIAIAAVPSRFAEAEGDDVLRQPPTRRTREFEGLSNTAGADSFAHSPHPESSSLFL